MRLQRLAQKRQIRIDDRSAQLEGALHAIHFDRAPHGVGMKLQLRGDGADLPVLGEKVMTDLYAQLLLDHFCFTCVSKCEEKDPADGPRDRRRCSAAQKQAERRLESATAPRLTAG